MFFKRFYKIKKKLDRLNQLEKRVDSLESRQNQNIEICQFSLNTPIGPVNVTAKIFRHALEK